MTLIQSLAGAFAGAQRKPTVVLASSPVLLLVWAYFCTPKAFESPVAGAVYHFLGCFVLLGVVPALVVKLVFRGRLRDYGLTLGVPGRTLGALILFLPVFVLAAYAGSTDPEVLRKFPINPRAGDSPALFALHASTYLLYYLGWEFYFRGFMLFGLRESLGDVNAVLVGVLASALLHIGSPASETFGSIPGGLLWGVLALYTRSILAGLAQHFLLGLTLDAFICFT